jgi:hypothetical protein
LFWVTGPLKKGGATLHKAMLHAKQAIDLVWRMPTGTKNLEKTICSDGFTMP